MRDTQPGWNQSHFYQWKKDVLQTAEINDDSRVFEFANDLKTIDITDGVFPDIHPVVIFGNEATSFIEWDGPVKQGIWIFVIDQYSGEPWVNGYPSQYGSTMNTSWAPEYKAFPYWTRTTDERRPAIDFLNDVVPDQAYVIVMTIQSNDGGYFPENWGSDPGSNLKTILESQGAVRFDELEQGGSKPYVFVYKKNDPSFAPVERVGNIDAPLQVDLKLPAKWFEGTMTTDLIGPASAWQTLDFAMGYEEDTDHSQVNLYGKTTTGLDTLIYSDINQAPFSLSAVDANEIPYLYLKYEADDEIRRSAPYMDYWRIIYSELPDAALNTNDGFVFEADTLGRGTNFVLKAKVENLRNVDMDSVFMRYTLVDVSNQEEIIEYKTAPLNGLGQVPIEYTRATDNLSGLYEFRLDINADRSQGEATFLNNLGALKFFVRNDGLNPVLDVTFDGIHILNGDIISPQPLIAVTLLDQSNILLDDVNDFELILEHPDGSLENDRCQWRFG